MKRSAVILGLAVSISQMSFAARGGNVGSASLSIDQKATCSIKISATDYRDREDASSTLLNAQFPAISFEREAPVQMRIDREAINIWKSTSAGPALIGGTQISKPDNRSSVQSAIQKMVSIVEKACASIQENGNRKNSLDAAECAIGVNPADLKDATDIANELSVHGFKAEAFAPRGNVVVATTANQATLYVRRDTELLTYSRSAIANQNNRAQVIAAIKKQVANISRACSLASVQNKIKLAPPQVGLANDTSDGTERLAVETCKRTGLENVADVEETDHDYASNRVTSVTCIR